MTARILRWKEAYKTGYEWIGEKFEALFANIRLLFRYVMYLVV